MALPFLQTPAAFTPLLDPPADAGAPLNFVFRGSQVLLHEATLGLPDDAACDALGIAPARWHAVGLLGARYCRAAWFEGDPDALPDGLALRGLRSLFDHWDGDLLGAAARAAQIAEWARTHRYCGSCAQPMARLPGERCYACRACNLQAYPRISPAMMVLVRRGDQVLLARHANSPTGRFSPLAGFLEAGESVEEAVHREVMEEVGLRVENLRYFGSQTWPFPHSLMVAFSAEYVSGEIRVDENEIAEARWFTHDEARAVFHPGVSISTRLVAAHIGVAHP
jgi:NAD+ diphosphatase